MFRGLQSKLASLFTQAAEAQQDIDDSARRIVEGIARMVDVESNEVPASRDDMPAANLAWYDEMGAAFAAEGFGAPVPFVSASATDRPPDRRTGAEYALGDDGTIAAAWFSFGATEKRAEMRIVGLVTLFEDGSSIDTDAGGTPSKLPVPPGFHQEQLPQDTPPAEVLARHRELVAAHQGTPRRFATAQDFLAARLERQHAILAFRRGLGMGLVEDYLAARFTGDGARVGAAYLEAFRRHPEWYKYSGGAPATPAAPSPLEVIATVAEAITGAPVTPGTPEARDAAAPAEEPDAALPLRFLISPTDDGRRTVTTFGMLFSGLPELMMSDVAANHCRAARVLLGTLSAGIARVQGAPASETGQHMARVVSATGARLVLTAADAAAAGLSPDGSEPTGGPVEVQLSLRGFTPQEEPSLLHVEPLPDEPGTPDERLREACARLGAAVPVARGADSAESAMREAHERSVARMGDVRTRWKSRDDGTVLVKTRVVRGETGEYVWVAVRDWRDGTIDGDVVTPAPRLGLARGESRSIDEADVYDLMVRGADGSALPALTDLVATDYGMDL